MFLGFLASSRKAAFLFLGLWCTHALLGAQQVRPDLPALTAIALEKNLDAHPVWQALIHQTEGKPQIQDSGFILSAAHFSSRNELKVTLAELFGSQTRSAMRCQFPARYLWLAQQLNLAMEPLTDCEALNEYTEKVPVDAISLIFASENLNQPSSMMGHVFLKLSGKNHEGLLREHAVTFYTDADTINLPKLLLQNASTGMPGFFSVLPYQELLSQYTEAEDRNVWDFEIRTEPWIRELLRLHLFELREVQLRYYFHTYNCANLIDELLTLVHANIKATPPADPLWTTPKDVVKRAHALGLIDSANVTPARTWMVRSIEKQLNADQTRAVMQWANGEGRELDLEKMGSDASHALAWQLASTYNDFLLAQKTISPAVWSQRQEQLLQRKPALPFELHVPDSANPQNAPGDSQISLGHTVRDGRAYLSASYLPASHTLLDDSAQGLGQSELKLAQMTVFKSLSNADLFLDEFVLYASQTQLPWSPLVGGVSRAVRLAYEPQYSQYAETRHAAHATTAWGLTYAITKDLFTYAELGAGLGLSERDLYWEASPGVGVLVNELWGMKSHFSYHQQHNALGKGGVTEQVDVTQKLRLTASSTLEISWSSSQGSNKDLRSTQTAWRWKSIF
jgi:hypothetical protein